MYPIIADLHTHTLSTTHAFHTLDAMAAEAAALGYRALAVTDHAPAMPDAPHIWHFQNQGAVDRRVQGVVMLFGAEANVMDVAGGLDMPQSLLAKQDWVVASIHGPCVPGLLTEREATNLWLAVAENPYVEPGHHAAIDCPRYLGLCHGHVKSRRRKCHRDREGFIIYPSIVFCRNCGH